MNRAAIGLRVHSGWTALLAVSMADGLPLVLSRQRIQLVKTFSYTFRQPYHTAARMDRVEAGKFVDEVRAEAEGIAREGLAALQAELKALGYRLGQGCLLLASGRKLPELEKILLSHALIHTADGELFREALRAASSRCMLRLTCIRKRDLLQTCAECFSRKPARLLSEVTKLGKGMGVVSEPIVVDGVIYVSAPQSKIYAVEAQSGKLLWKFDPKVKLNQSLNGSYSARTNAGVAVWNGKVYVGTGDCRLVAIDASTAKQVWEATVCEPSQTGITGAPHVAKGKIVMGFNGSDDGVRGALVAYDAETGKEAWRFWTVPGDPSKPFESKALEMAAKTWSGKDWWTVGGGDVWNAITYDDVTGLVIFGTAGAGADYGELAAVKATGEKLFSQCIVAVKADTGEYVWHYQTGTEGVHSENNHIVMADLMLNGEKRHVALTVPKNGFFYILDAKIGKFISAKPMVKTTWATSVDQETGKPVLVPVAKGGGKQWTVHNWWPMSYSTATNLGYVPTTDRREGTKAPVEAGESGEGLYGRLTAWDPISQTARWSVEEEISVNGGVLSTAGNLVFQGQGTGEFAAYTADTGKKLWSVKTGSAIESIPVTFSQGGDQYVITAVGWGSGSRLFAPARTMATPESKRGPVRLYSFKLNGKIPFPYPHIEVPPVPEPPVQKASKEIIKKGEKLYVSFYCEGCHSPGIDGSGAWVLDGAIPDLRYAPADVHKDWYQIVMGGSHWDKGMPGLADPPKFAFPNKRMTVADADAVHAYVIDQAWKAYREEQKEKQTKVASKN